MEEARFEQFSFLHIVTNSTYIFYRVFLALEGIRTKKWWSVAVSISKLFIFIVTMVVKGMSLQIPHFRVSLIGVNLLVDSYATAKMERFL